MFDFVQRLPLTATVRSMYLEADDLRHHQSKPGFWLYTPLKAIFLFDILVVDLVRYCYFRSKLASIVPLTYVVGSECSNHSGIARK